MRTHKNMSRKNQRGFTLIESLLTLFVLTIGVLGAAGLQMQGLRAGGVAMQRITAVMKAQEIVERMRANNNIAQRLATAGAAVSIVSYDNAGAGTDGGCNTGSACDMVAMAANDIFMWRTDLASTLPGFVDATVTVTPPATNSAPVRAVVTISWIDRGDNYSYSMTVDI